jgi:hypothetical protein
MSGTCSTHDREEKYIKIFVGKHEGKTLLRTLKHGWEDNIQIILNKRNESVDQVNVAENGDQWRALVNAVVNLGIP